MPAERRDLDPDERRDRATATRLVVGITSGLGLLTLLFASEPFLDLLVLLILGVLWLMLYLVWVVWVLVTSRDLATTHRARTLRAWAVPPILVLLVAILAVGRIPFHARFAISEPAFRDVAERLMEHPDARVPTSIGLFRIEGAQGSSFGAYFRTGTAGLFGTGGIVYLTGPGSPAMWCDWYQRIRAGWWRCVEES